MLLKTFVTGALQVNTYVLACEQSAAGAIIDPGGDAQRIERFLKQKNIDLKYIINTHGHPDHIMDNGKLKRSYPQAQLIIHRDDAQMLVEPDPMMLSFMPGTYLPVPADLKLEDGGLIDLGTIKLKVIHTPGHTLGGICLLTDKLLFSGDTLFAGGIGRTDFEGGSYPVLINSIKTKLFSLDHGLKVLPGHGPSSTIAQEIEYNPFLN